jgi:carboxymethylenebutenolidase
MPVQSTTVDVPTGDGAADAILAAPLEGGPYPGVLVYMDAFGLRPRLEEMASRIAAEGYVVLVPNVFYRAGRAPLVEVDGLDQPDVRARAFGTLRPIMQGLTPDLAMRDADAYLAFLAADPRVGDGPMGTVGYCMGGALALRTAAHFPERVAAAASFHGGRLATDQPDSPHLLADRLEAEVYLGHADNDASITPEQQETLVDALTSAGVRFVSEVYDGAAHGFTMADTAAYDEGAEARHWDRLLDLFARTLR